MRRALFDAKARISAVLKRIALKTGVQARRRRSELPANGGLAYTDMYLCATMGIHQTGPERQTRAPPNRNSIHD